MTLCHAALVMIHQRGDRWSEMAALEVLTRIAQQRGDVEQVVMLAHEMGKRYRELAKKYCL